MQLLKASRNEPSGGPGWREGLGMLAQFGRTIFDALVALELAVRESQQDNYAVQLEPELGCLAADIQSGFQYLAKCIHSWRFHIPPANIDLEEDIAQLEERMDKVRHTGYNFSQAEILRAYAVAATSETDCAPAALFPRGNRPRHWRSAAQRRLAKKLA